MKKLIIIPILVVVSAILIILIYNRQQASELPDDIIYSSGTVEANKVAVSAQVSAKVTEKRIQKGTSVAAGDTLFLLDDDVMQTRLGEIAAGKSSIQSEISAARIELDNAKKNLDRLKNAFEVGSVPKSKLDDAEAAYDSGRSRIKSLSAKIDQLEAQRSTLEVQIGYTVVTSPTNGVVQADPVDEGELAIAGSTLAELVDLSDTWVEIFIGEEDLPSVQIGDTARVHLDSAPDKPFKGQVSFISQEAEFTPKNIQTKKERVKLVFAVRVNVDNSSHVFKPGLPVDVYLDKR